MTNPSPIKTPQATKSDREILKSQLKLPDYLDQSFVVIQFHEPIPKQSTQEFMRVRLNPAYLREGNSRAEDRFFRPETIQKHRTGRQVCARCKLDMKRENEHCCRCLNVRCQNYRRLVVCGPLRGVVLVETDVQIDLGGQRKLVSFIAGVEKKTIRSLNRVIEVEMAHSCAVVLDRRYDEKVRADVYRTCGLLAEQHGWKIR